MVRRKLLATAILLCLSAVAASAQGGSPIRFQHSTNGSLDATDAYAINNAGEIAGCVSTGVSLPLKAMIYRNGQYTIFEYAPPPGPGPQAITCLTGINNKGQAVGFFSAPEEFATFLREPDGRLVRPSLINIPNAQSQVFSAINDHGDIAGTFFLNARMHGYVRRRNGHYTVIDFPGPALSGGQFSSTEVNGINNSRVITGIFRTYDIHGFPLSAIGFIYEHGHFRKLHCPGAGTGLTALPRAVNKWGQILAACETGNYVINRHGAAVPVNSDGLEFPAFNGLNDYADVVGFDFAPLGAEADTPESFIIPSVAPVHK